MSRRGGCTSVDVEVTCDPDVFFWLVQNAGGGWWRLELTQPNSLWPAALHPETEIKGRK